MQTKDSFFDVPYAIPSAILTSGVTIVATTAANYVGMAVSASAAAVIVLIYNNSSTASGGFVDVFGIPATTVGTRNLLLPTKASKGLTVDIQGAGAKATVFYAPKG